MTSIHTIVIRNPDDGLAWFSNRVGGGHQHFEVLEELRVAVVDQLYGVTGPLPSADSKVRLVGQEVECICSQERRKVLDLIRSSLMSTHLGPVESVLIREVDEIKVSRIIELATIVY